MTKIAADPAVTDTSRATAAKKRGAARFPSGNQTGRSGPPSPARQPLAEPDFRDANREDDRYHLVSVTGRGGTYGKLATIWHVHDTCNCWRLVATYKGHGGRSSPPLIRALRRASMLNALERIWEQEHA